jgi:hypothetical protein
MFGPEQKHGKAWNIMLFCYQKRPFFKQETLADSAF